jgi:hypothetical protein
VIGPIVEDFIWQAKAGKGFATSDFRIDWENTRAVCPQGKLSRGRQVARADCVMEIIHIQFLRQGIAWRHRRPVRGREESRDPEADFSFEDCRPRHR